MKTDTLKIRIKRSWPTVFQPVLVLLAFIVGVGSFVLVANGKPKPARAPKSPPPPPSILMVGDSLSAGKFGEAIQQHLEKKYRVAAYASCGSSPEHWLRDEPVFYTKCGYREWTSERQIFQDSTPHGMRTPKIETLVARHKPTVVVIQLGTNWMDRNLSEDQMNNYLDRLVQAARRGGTVQKIIWITPPDSSSLRKVQGKVHALIQRAARRDRFELVDSRRVTHYQVGKTGGDGVHYNSAASQAWAEGIRRDLDAKVATAVRDTKFSKLTPQGQGTGSSGSDL